MSAAVAERVQRRLEVALVAAGRALGVASVVLVAVNGAHGAALVVLIAASRAQGGALSTVMTSALAAGSAVGGVVGGGAALAGCAGADSKAVSEGRAAGEDDVAMRIEGSDAIMSSPLACSAAPSSSCASGAKRLDVVTTAEAEVERDEEDTGDGAGASAASLARRAASLGADRRWAKLLDGREDADGEDGCRGRGRCRGGRRR